MKAKDYISNCFILLIPVFLWNMIFADYLPEAYSPTIFENEIPRIVGYSENCLRIIVFVLPITMRFSLKTKLQRLGFLTYLLGLIVYFSSWLVMMLAPNSSWSQSLIGFMAPAYTTLVFFIGIGLIGNKTFFKSSHMSTIYICLSILFVMIHSTHTYIVFQQL